MDQPSSTPPPVPPSAPPSVPVPPIPTQARMPLPPTTFRVPPPEPPPKKSGLVGTLVVCGLMGVGLMGFVGKVALKRLGKARSTAQLTSSTMNPYDVMSRDYSRNPSTFKTGVAKGAARGLKKNVPQATFTLDDAAQVDDLGKALRTVIHYRGELPTPDGEISLQGQLRQYVHPSGMVMVETACFSKYSMCLELDDLATSTDERVLAHLEVPTRSFLPPDADCQAARAGNSGRQMQVCKLGEEMIITFQNLTLEETRREFQRIAVDPAFKDLN